MKTLYLDCFSGISGDMMLGTLLDAGADEQLLRAELQKLGLKDEFTLEVQKRKSHGVIATGVSVRLRHGHEGHHHHGRHLPEILNIIQNSGIQKRAADTARAIFNNLARAEARVHGVDVQAVHFHEVGAVDAIVDIVGTAVMLDMLDIGNLCVGPVRTGSGLIRCAHGELPVPAPATALLLQGFEVYAGDESGEFTTPTGAAILATLCQKSEALPPMRLMRTAYGLGSRECKRLNALRVLIGDMSVEETVREGGFIREEIIEMRANLDDMTGEALSFAMQRLLCAGALDVCYAPAVMKQGRPAVVLTVLCEASRQEALLDVLFQNTTTLGVRYERVRRAVLPRKVCEVQTPYGPVRVKYARNNAHPEYQDCARVAERRGISLLEVQRAALEAFFQQKGNPGLNI